MTDPSPPRPLWDVPQCAEHLKLSERTVRVMVSENRLPFTRLGGSLRFDPDAIDAYIKAKTIQAVK